MLRLEKYKGLYKFLLLLTVSVLVVSCGGDDDDSGSGVVDDTQNANRNNPATSVTEVLRLEFPKVKGGTSIVVVHSTDKYGVNYAVEWDCEKKAQRWTCYQMYSGNSVATGSRKGWWGDDDPFQEDLSIPAAYRTTLADYRGSGFNRGHICPSADRLCSKEANEQTFYLSNIQPQWYSFNVGVWEKMEERVRKWNTSSFRDTLYVCKGGTIDSEANIRQRTTSGLIVPKYFFMAILCKNSETVNNGYKAIAFWVEHTDEDHSDDDLRDYAISIDELERKTGIDFFCNLPDGTENHIEATMNTVSWTWK